MNLLNVFEKEIVCAYDFWGASREDANEKRIMWGNIEKFIEDAYNFTYNHKEELEKGDLEAIVFWITEARSHM